MEEGGTAAGQVDTSAARTQDEGSVPNTQDEKAAQDVVEREDGVDEQAAGDVVPGGGDDEGWYILDETGQPVGPYDVTTMEGYAGYGYVLPDTLVWRKGRGEWVAMREVEELASASAYAESYVAAVAAGAAEGQPNTDQPGMETYLAATDSTADQPQGSANEQAQAADGALAPAAGEMGYALGGDAAGYGANGAAYAAGPLSTVEQPQGSEGGDGAEQDPLAAFKAEISALEGIEGEGEPERVPTPDPEDRRFEDDDGTIYVWEPTLRKFVEEGSMPAAPAYNPEDMVFEMDEEIIPEYKPPADDDEDDDMGVVPERPAKSVAPAEAAKTNGGAEGLNGKQNGAKGKEKKGKRTAEDVMEKHKEKAKRAKEQAEKEQSWVDIKATTSVYVTGLPDDVTEDELEKVFSKCGIVKRDEETKKPRVKVYRDKQLNVPKGDGLVTYMLEPSVVLALQILDGAPFRPEMTKTMTVQRAKFEMHGEQFIPKKKPKKKKKGPVNMDKILGWGGFDDVRKVTDVTVILKNMFHPDDFYEDFNLKGDLERDVRTECGKCGQVEKIWVYDQNPEGVVRVKFKTEDPAAACIAKMNGRYFGGRQVEAFMWDGITNYNVKVKETAEEERARLEKYTAELEAAEINSDLAEKLRKEQEQTAAESGMDLG